MSTVSRRGVLGGASLVVMSAGAALVPAAAAENPDAALLALCAAFHQREAERQASDGVAFDLARDREWEAFDAVAAAPPAITEAGRAAKARVAFAMTSRSLLPATPLDGSGQLDDDDVFARRVLAEVGGVALSPGPATEHPDAELFTACEQFARQEAEYGRLSIATDWPANAPCTPAMAALEQEFAALSEAHHANGFWIAEYSPKTFAGIQAKARAVLVYVGENDPTHDMIGALERSICRDLAGGGGVA